MDEKRDENRVEDREDTREGSKNSCEDGWNHRDAWGHRGGHRWWKRQPMGVKALLIVGGVVLGIAALVGMFVLFGNIVMGLWNWLMPEIFGLKTITFWQAWGLTILSMILFGRAGASGSGDHGKSRRRKMHDKMGKVAVAEVSTEEKV